LPKRAHKRVERSKQEIEIEHRSGISSIYVLVIELEIKYLPLLYLQSSSINIDPIA
ncbi:hypothetical protein A2U01_0036599, partial [Trifolium medium]|nr:hypothetical protein [Trifolium medium]